MPQSPKPQNPIESYYDFKYYYEIHTVILFKDFIFDHINNLKNLMERTMTDILEFDMNENINLHIQA